MSADVIFRLNMHCSANSKNEAALRFSPDYQHIKLKIKLCERPHPAVASVEHDTVEPVWYNSIAKQKLQQSYKYTWLGRTHTLTLTT